MELQITNIDHTNIDHTNTDHTNTDNLIVKNFVTKQSVLNQSVFNFFHKRSAPITKDDIPTIKSFIKQLEPNYKSVEKQSSNQYELSIYKVNSYNSYKLNLTCYGNKLFLYVEFNDIKYTQYPYFTYIIQNYSDSKIKIESCVYDTLNNNYINGDTWNTWERNCIKTPSGYINTISKTINSSNKSLSLTIISDMIITPIINVKNINYLDKDLDLRSIISNSNGNSIKSINIKLCNDSYIIYRKQIYYNNEIYFDGCHFNTKNSINSQYLVNGRKVVKYKEIKNKIKCKSDIYINKLSELNNEKLDLYLPEFMYNKECKLTFDFISKSTNSTYYTVKKLSETELLYTVLYINNKGQIYKINKQNIYIYDQYSYDIKCSNVIYKKNVENDTSQLNTEIIKIDNDIFTFTYLGVMDYMKRISRIVVSKISKVFKKSNITQYQYKNGHEDKSINIDENNKMDVKTASVYGKLKGTYGYKAAQTENHNMCIIKIFIPDTAKHVWDQKYEKYRTNECMVISIKPVTFDTKNFYYVDELKIKNCSICCDDKKYETHMAYPCRHKFCYDCWEQVFKISAKCSYCRQDVEKVIELPKSKTIINGSLIDDLTELSLNEATSCVYTTDFIYKLGENYKIHDFSTELNGKCSNGFYYHETDKETFKWFEHLDIPDHCLETTLPYLNTKHMFNPEPLNYQVETVNDTTKIHVIDEPEEQEEQSESSISDSDSESSFESEEE